MASARLISLESWRNAEMPIDAASGYKNKLVDSLYRLLCEKEENNEDWIRRLDEIQIEVMGWGNTSINCYKLRALLGSLKYLHYPYFRSTVFNCIKIIQSMDL